MIKKPIEANHYSTMFSDEFTTTLLQAIAAEQNANTFESNRTTNDKCAN